MAEKTLVAKLLEIQKDLKAPKGQYNSFGKYNYRSAEDIVEAVKPLNAEKGLLLTLTDEATLVGDWHYIKAIATITDGKDSLSVSAYARESLTKKGMDDSQITGTASSYARKYALNGLYLIDDTKDADTDEYQNKQNRGNNQGNKGNQNRQNQQQQKPDHIKGGGITAEQKKQMIALANKIAADIEGMDLPTVYASAQTTLKIQKKMADLTEPEAAKFIDYLKNWE